MSYREEAACSVVRGMRFRGVPRVLVDETAFYFRADIARIINENPLRNPEKRIRDFILDAMRKARRATSATSAVADNVPSANGHLNAVLQSLSEVVRALPAVGIKDAQEKRLHEQLARVEQGMPDNSAKEKTKKRQLPALMRQNEAVFRLVTRHEPDGPTHISIKSILDYMADLPEEQREAATFLIHIILTHRPVKAFIHKGDEWIPFILPLLPLYYAEACSCVKSGQNVRDALCTLDERLIVDEDEFDRRFVALLSQRIRDTLRDDIDPERHYLHSRYHISDAKDHEITIQFNSDVKLLAHTLKNAAEFPKTLRLEDPLIDEIIRTLFAEYVSNDFRLRSDEAATRRESRKRTKDPLKVSEAELDVIQKLTQQCRFLAGQYLVRLRLKKMKCKFTEAEIALLIYLFLEKKIPKKINVPELENHLTQSLASPERTGAKLHVARKALTASEKNGLHLYGRRAKPIVEND